MLSKEYGLPVWGSYALFAIGTILLGAILGLILVCVIDFMFPPKSAHRKSFSEHKKNLQHEKVAEEIKGDELEDEDEQVAGVQDEEEEDDDEEEDVNETSDGEKYSGSESEEAPESEQKDDAVKQEKDSPAPSPKASPKEETKKKDTNAGSPDVRKRKSRKADWTEGSTSGSGR